MCGDGGCFRSFAKIVLIIVNIIFLLAGLLMLAFGISLVVAPEKVIKFILSSGVDFDSFQNTSDGFFQEIIRACGIFMIILGSVVALIACFGFFGACCNSKFLLVTYAVILIIILLAEVALIIFAAVFPREFQNIAEKALKESLQDFRSDVKVDKNGTIDKSGVTTDGAIWISFQTEFECCGATNFTDYQSFDWKRTSCSTPDVCNDQGLVPLSCCKLKDPSKAIDAITLNDYVDYKGCLSQAKVNSTNTNGCTKAVMDSAKHRIMNYSKIAIGIAAGIVGLEIILIVFAFILCCMEDSKYV